MNERIVVGVTGPADRLLAAGLADLQPVLAGLRGHVVLVGGVMSRLWLHARPLEDIPPRSTADVDLGIDRTGLGLRSNQELVKPLLQRNGFTPTKGDEAFRFEKSFGEAETLLVDIFIPKGQSREQPPVLEKDVETLAAPGLAYAVSRGPFYVDAEFVDGESVTAIELPLPTLDAAFVLKGALAASGVRTMRDRRERDVVDTVMLAAACLGDDKAIAALRAARNKEARRAIEWTISEARDLNGSAATTVRAYLETQFALPDGDRWAAQVARTLERQLRRAH